MNGAKDPQECSSTQNLLKFGYFVQPKWRSQFPSRETDENLLDPTFSGVIKSFDEKILVGEKSPNYFVESRVPKRIKKYNPHAKIILLLCEPSERALSDFAHFQRQISRNNPHQMLNLAGSTRFRHGF